MPRHLRINIDSPETIAILIHVVRSQKVMIDSDLARLYGVPTKRLLEQVKRNVSRFPPDFAFQLTKQEFAGLRSQNATSKSGGRRYLPLVFTEQGVAMLSSVLRTERAVQANIAIIRTFVHLRSLLASNRELAFKFAELERKVEGHDADIGQLFAAIQSILADPPGPKRLIGFNREHELP